MALLLFLLVHCGGVYVVTQSMLTKLPREALRRQVRDGIELTRNTWEIFVVLPLGFVLAVVQCPPCFGFWWALGLQQLGYWPFTAHISAPIEAGLAGVAIGALWGFHTTAEVQDATTKEKEDDR